MWVLLDNDYKDVRDHDGNVLYRIKDCIDDFPYDYYGDQGKKHTVKLREKQVATFNPKLAEKQIFEKAIENARKLAGYNLMVTSELSMSAAEIYAACHNLWRIEESFRIMKSQLDARHAI